MHLTKYIYEKHLLAEIEPIPFLVRHSEQGLFGK